MDWIELRVHTTNEAIEPVSNMLIEMGANGVVHDDPKVLENNDVLGERYELNPNKYPAEGLYIKAYFLEDDEIDNIVEQVISELDRIESLDIDLGKKEVTLEKVSEIDWENEWKKFFKPAKVSERIVIVPSWETYKKTHKDEAILTIDPGMAFGTGTHPTTVLSIRALEDVIRKGNTVLDVGSGSGILSIASILLGANIVHAYDFDKVAVSSTKANRDLNKMQKQIKVKQNDLLKGVNEKANVIVSNILAHILVDLVDDAYELLEDKGYFITSGIITDKAHLVKEKLEEANFKIVEINKIEKWVSFVAQK
ncbi:MAG TPA: 50S ribosomal protein L11 methyltransferase [Pseudogracilibacillus sp.]|nr:50S ribosomal protein L11 methyltransferase [Pseudogracilibacillus sp.]